MNTPNYQINFDDPADGAWVMMRVGGVYNERIDHVIALYRDGRVMGGVVFTGFLQGGVLVHMAGSGGNWATRDFLWMIFHHGFIQLGCKKMIGLVASDNPRALSVNVRLGFIPEGRITDVCPNGADLIIFTMTKDRCKWLKWQPVHYRSGSPTEVGHG